MRLPVPSQASLVSSPSMLEPARRRLNPSSSVKAAATWAQQELVTNAVPQKSSEDLSSAHISFPTAGQPLRVEPPAEYNSPARVQPLQHGLGSKPQQVLSSKLARRPLTGMPTAKAMPEKMRDYAVLASACRRAGKATSAAHLVFNRGVLFENMGESTQALHCYKDLLRSSLELGDSTGEALACNSIGVLLQLTQRDSLEEALRYHQQHLAVADVPGKFIAHCNLGLCYQALEMLEDARANHQHALRYAIRMSSLAGESLACGHLGMVSRLADRATAKACTERQLHLASTLHDQKGKEDAFFQLGGLAHLDGSWNEAKDYYHQALHVAQQQQDSEGSDLARCNVGLAQGNAEFEAYMLSISNAN